MLLIGILGSTVLMSGCSMFPAYVSYKATPDTVIERQKQETINLETYHRAERDYYKALAVSASASGVNAASNKALKEAKATMDAAKANMVIVDSSTEDGAE